MREIFAHCFLDESHKKYLEENFSVKVHNANEKILSPDELISHASGYDGIISQGNIISNEYIKNHSFSISILHFFTI